MKKGILEILIKLIHKIIYYYCSAHVNSIHSVTLIAVMFTIIRHKCVELLIFACHNNNNKIQLNSSVIVQTNKIKINQNPINFHFGLLS